MMPSAKRGSIGGRNRRADHAPGGACAVRGAARHADAASRSLGPGQGAERRLMTALGTYEIYKVISTANITSLQIIFASLFALTFAWIAFSCASACLGFWQIATGRERLPRLAPIEDTGRTALLMPVYNEDPKRATAALEKMGSEIIRLGAADRFDIFILSDTRDLRIALDELHALDWLKKALFPHMR